MREKTILVVIPVREEHRELLEEAAPGNHFVYSSIREVSREQVQEADIILGNVPADKIGASKKLQWLPELTLIQARAFWMKIQLSQQQTEPTERLFPSICLPCC